MRNLNRKDQAPCSLKLRKKITKTKKAYRQGVGALTCK